MSKDRMHAAESSKLLSKLEAITPGAQAQRANLGLFVADMESASVNSITCSSKKYTYCNRTDGGGVVVVVLEDGRGCCSRGWMDGDRRVQQVVKGLELVTVWRRIAGTNLMVHNREPLDVGETNEREDIGFLSK
jgi:hypothetical protein